MTKHFTRRANNFEFSPLRYIIYLNFATVIQLQGQTIDALLRYGQDQVYNSLQWHDKILLLDISHRAKVPYMKQIYTKISIDFMLQYYNNLLHEFSLESIIQLIGIVRNIDSQNEDSLGVQVEFWQKMQLLLVKAFEFRHDEYEVQEYEGNQIPSPPLAKEHILILANILIENGTSGQLRDPDIINYLFKSVFELVEFTPDSYKIFDMADITTLIDAFYQSQMPLSDKYGNLFIEILVKQNLLSQQHLETQPIRQTLKFFRGFLQLQDSNWSESNK